MTRKELLCIIFGIGGFLFLLAFFVFGQMAMLYFADEVYRK